MPSHQERIKEYYKDRCIRCLKNENREWMGNEVANPFICEPCFWREYFSDPKNGKCPEHLKHYLEE